MVKIMNASFLKGFMEKYHDTHDDLAEALSIHPKTLYVKLGEYNGACFTLAELRIIANRYHLTAEQIKDIFFD